MKKLAQSFESLGYQSVKTYINTGNIVFSVKDRSIALIQDEIHRVIQKDFGLDIPVLVLDEDRFGHIAQSIPDHWVNNQETKCDVLFLFSDVDNKEILDDIPITPEIDTVQYVPGAVLFYVERKNQTKSGPQKLVGQKLYRQMTVRNVNTARKIGLLFKK